MALYIKCYWTILTCRFRIRTIHVNLRGASNRNNEWWLWWWVRRCINVKHLIGQIVVASCDRFLTLADFFSFPLGKKRQIAFSPVPDDWIEQHFSSHRFRISTQTHSGSTTAHLSHWHFINNWTCAMQTDMQSLQ